MLFFVSVGMLFDPHILIERPLAVLGALAIILFGKSIAAWLLVTWLGHSRRTAMTISVSLAQIGEFAFILAGLGVSLGLLNDDGRNLVLAAAIMSIMINPVMFTLAERYLMKTEQQSDNSQPDLQEEEPLVPLEICNHAVIVGYGRVGSLLCQKLNKLRIPVVVIETTRARVEVVREQGIHAVSGNAARHEIMDVARLDCARWLLLTIPNGYESGEIIAAAREKRPDIAIIARAHYDDEVTYIMERGANRVIMGEREIANSMLDILETEIEEQPVSRECPV